MPSAGHRAGKDRRGGFTFPARVAITVVGNADAGLDARVPELVAGAGGEVVPASIRRRASRNGNYVSITLEFDCPARARYEGVHAVLRAEPAVRYTL